MLSAAPIITMITQADIDALDSADTIWNAQFFPGKGSMPDVQYSVGSGLNGVDLPRGTTTWVQDPSVNPISVGITSGGTLQANANSSGIVSHGVTGAYNEIYVFIRDTTPTFVPGDFLEIRNVTDGTNSFPSLFVEPENGFAGFKIQYDTFPSNIGEFNLTADLVQKHISAAEKDWNVNYVGVTAIPEPSSLVLLLVASVAVCGILRRRK